MRVNWKGLGQRFWDEVDEYIIWITQNPEVPRLRPGGYRRVNLKIFSYYIPYIIRDPMIWILAIAHGHTRPEYCHADAQTASGARREWLERWRSTESWTACGARASVHLRLGQS